MQFYLVLLSNVAEPNLQCKQLKLGCHIHSQVADCLVLSWNTGSAIEYIYSMAYILRNFVFFYENC